MRHFLILLVLFIFSGCSDYCKDKCEKEYSSGYKSGYERGHSSGYNKGYNEGYRLGYSEGNSVGLEKGYLDGTKTYVEGNLLPSLGFTIIILILLVVVIAFKKFGFNPIKTTFSYFVMHLHNVYIYICINIRSFFLQKQEYKKAEIMAKISSLELFMETSSIINELDYNQEFFIILSKVENYLLNLSHVSRKNLSSEVRKLAKMVLFDKSFSNSERSSLLHTIHVVLNSRISKIHNVTMYQKMSYNKIIFKCQRYIKHRTLYVFLYNFRRFIFSFLVSLNFFIILGLVIHHNYDISLLSNFSYFSQSLY